MEIVQELPTVDYIIVPVGGGGLVAGVSTLAKMLNPKIKVIGVEPSEAASMKAALKAGEPVTLPSANTIADGTAVKRVGSLTFEYAKKNVDQILTVDDDELIGCFPRHGGESQDGGRKFRPSFCCGTASIRFEREKGSLHFKRWKYGCHHHGFYRTAWSDPERPDLLCLRPASG